jgi:hypothetical protein
LVRLRVRVGNSEVEVEAESEKLTEVINTIPSILEKLRPSVTEQSRGFTDEKKESSPPQIKIEKEDSLADIIEKMLSSEWGSSERKLSEIREVLRLYGLNYPKQSVAVALLRLAKAGKIRRFKTESGDYAYTSSYPAAISLEKGSGEQDLSAE